MSFIQFSSVTWRPIKNEKKIYFKLEKRRLVILFIANDSSVIEMKMHM